MGVRLKRAGCGSKKARGGDLCGAGTVQDFDHSSGYMNLHKL